MKCSRFNTLRGSKKVAESRLFPVVSKAPEVQDSKSMRRIGQNLVE